MDRSPMAGEKRDHDDFVGGDAAALSNAPKLMKTKTLQRRALSPSSDAHASPRKKLKIYHDPTEGAQDETTAPERNNKPLSVGATETDHSGVEDAAMSDSDMETSQVEASITQDQARAIATSTPNVRASDLANNPFAPPATSVEALKAYLQEVGTLDLYLTRTPLQTPNSKFAENARGIIFNRVFNGWSNSDCIGPYNEQGGNVNGIAGISKRFQETAPGWFREENVVLPWKYRGNKEHKRLRDMGLTEANFPLLDRTGYFRPVSTQETPQSSRKANAGKKKTQPANVAPPSRKGHSNIKLVMDDAPPEYRGHMSMMSMGRAEDSSHEDEMEGQVKVKEEELETEDDDNESEQSNPDHNARQAAIEEERARQAAIAEAIQEQRDEEDTVCFPDSMRDRVRAALNVFGKDLASFSSDGKECTLSTAALIKHCGAAREQQENETDMADFPPNIVRAFVNAISPCPSNGLPRHDYKFCEERLEQGVNSDDVLGVMDHSTVGTRTYNWNMNRLKQLNDLAVTMDCGIVQDMVVDKVCELYAKHVGDGTVSDFPVPVSIMNELDPDKNDKFLRMLVDIMIDQNAKGIPYPSAMSLGPHVTKMVVQREDSKDRGFHCRTQDEYCSCYHLHGEDEPCYKVQMLETSTTELIHQFYDCIAQDAETIHRQVAASIPCDDYYQCGRQLQRQTLVRWSQYAEKKTALNLLKLEGLKKHKLKQRALGHRVEMKYRLRKRAHEREVLKMRCEHDRYWNCFDGDHGDCEHDKPRKEIVISLVPGLSREEMAEVW